MDKLKYVKIENDDGTLSENIPVGVDAENVDVSIAGGSENLQTNLDSKQTEINSLKTQTQTNTTSIAANTNAINVEKSRIDNLAHLEEGSTTGDAELIDIRTGYDGINYSSAGNAVRGQTKQNNFLMALDKYVKIDNTNPFARKGYFQNASESIVIFENYKHIELTTNEITEVSLKLIRGSQGSERAFFVVNSNGEVIEKEEAILTSTERIFNLKLSLGDTLYLNIFEDYYELYLKNNLISTEIENQIMLNLKAEVIEDIENSNIYNYYTDEQNCYYSYLTGIKTSIATSASSNLIPINENTTFIINNKYHHICYYDENKTFISGSLHGNVDPAVFITPSKTRYMRISGEKIVMGQTLMIFLGNTLPSTYVPFNQYLKNWIVDLEVKDARGSFACLKDRIDSIDNTMISRFLPYQSGWITFSVSVNQYVVDNSDTGALIDNESDIENVNCVLQLPSTYSVVGKPVKLLMICHGARKRCCWK